MVRIDDLAEAARDGEALKLRSLAQDWLEQNQPIAQSAAPITKDATLLAIAAGLVELFAQRRHEPPPKWAEAIPAAPGPVYLLKAARTFPRLRQLCETESPDPLRRRHLLAPPTFLEPR